MGLYIYRFICCQRNEQLLIVRMFCDASDAAMQKAEVITRRIGRLRMLNYVPLQYQATPPIGSFQMDTKLGTQEKANT
jgi:hypothetical protein